MKAWEELCEELKRGDELVTRIFDEADALAKIISQIINKREELGYSQRDLARICKLPQSSIARIESCRVIPKIDTLLKIMSPLGLSLLVTSKNC